MKTKHTMYVAALLAVVGQLANAHTELSASVPADKAVLEAAPKEVMLHFSEPVRLTALSVQKEGQSKQSVGPLPADASEHFVVVAPTLSEGRYTVSWRALSGDAYVMTGDFAFTLGASGTPAPHPLQAQPSESSHSGHSKTL
jgi:methionine-rich copper-binding protein CopC